MKCVDIGQSVYSQLQTLLKVDNQNTEVSADSEATQAQGGKFKAAWEPKASRMLKLTLTDGFKSIYAIEHERVNTLSYPLEIGCKIKLMPPLTCRKGTILLVSKNVQFLGGSVEEMQEEFNQISTLQSMISIDNQNILGQNALPNTNNTNSNNVIPPVKTENQRIQSNQENNPFDDDDEDFMRLIDDENQPPNAMPSSGHGQSPRNETVVESSRFNKEDFITQPLVNVKTETPMSVFNEKPFTYLCKIPEKVEDWADDAVYVIKGCIVTVQENLTAEKDPNADIYNWKLKVLVTDGTQTRSFHIHHVLMAKWIGAIPEQYKSSSASEKEEIKKAISQVSQKLFSINGLLKLQRVNSQPTITEVISLNKGHVQQLKNRVSKAL